MADDIVQVIADTRTDAATLQQVVNGDADTQITSRLGESYPSVQKAIKLMTQSGLSFTAFETKSLMTASSLANGSYAIVTNDTTINNGLHIKKSGSWSKVSYDIDERQKTYTDVVANTALVSAKTYADGVGTSALSQSKTYTDTAAAVALSQSKTYTDTAKTSAINTAATDATTKANAAQAAAIASAAIDATTKANSALTQSKTYTDTAKTSAISAAATDATTKANNAVTTASADATTKANAAQSAAISTASTDATTKTNAAITTAATDATEKSNAALASSKTYTDTKAGEALTKANEAADMADAVDLTIKSITSSETDRVGDAPELFSDVIKAEPNPIILDSQLYISQIPKIGKVLTVKNKSGYVATRKAVPVYSGHSYSLSASLLRVVNPTDPLNDTVEVGVEWLNQAKQSISHQVISSLTLDSADGITVIDEPIFPTAASAYVRAWFRIYGSDSETALIYLSANDITDAKKVTADIAQSALITLASAKTYTDTAQTDAIATAATDATTKADAAIASAATDATTKADAAQAAAISAAATDATTKADAALSSSKTYADVGDVELKAAISSELDTVDYTAKVVAENTAGIYPTASNNLDAVWGVIDREGRAVVAVDNLGNTNVYGDFKLPSYQTSTFSDDNNLEACYSIIDSDNRVLLALDKNGNTNVYGDFNLPSYQTTTLNEDNNLKAYYTITDSENRVLLAVGKNGVINPDSQSIYIKDGNLFTLSGNNSKQVTTDGNVIFAEKMGDGIRYVSDATGIISEYYYDGSKSSRYYAEDRGYDQIIVTGQSLAMGHDVSITETNQFAKAIMFSPSPVTRGNNGTEPMTEPLKEFEHETISSGFANSLLTVGNDKPVLVGGHAMGGQTYARVKKGGASGVYEKTMNYVRYASYLPNGSLVKAIFVIHGEADGVGSSTTYASDLREWLNDFNADIKLTNSQRDNALMFYCQTSSASGYLEAGERDSFNTPFLQLDAHNNNPDLILVCPKYHLDYVDYAHADSVSTRLLGEYYAKAYRKVIIEGKPWKPTTPINIVRTGASIVIDYDMMAGPLVIDTDYIATGSDNEHYGFVLKNASGVTITNVALSGNRQVTITTSDAVPNGAVLTYAFDNGTHPLTGRTQGARGNIRDSDRTKSIYTNQNLYNWSLIFKHTFGE